MKILIVDDSKAMRAIVKRSLRQAGYGSATLLEATSAEDAASQITNEHPDIVLLDVNMPGQSGLAMARELIAQDLDFKFGLVTAEQAADILDEARDLGAEFIINKPFTADLLGEALKAALA